MTDQEEYNELKEDAKKIMEKIREGGSDDELIELCSKLDTIKRRQSKIRIRSNIVNWK